MLASKHPKILVLGAGALHDVHYKLLRAGGYYTIGMDRNPAAPARGEADTFCCDDPGDTERVIAAAREYRVDAILPLAEFGVVPAAAASQKLGLNHISPETAKMARDKFLMRQAWRGQDIDQPNFYLATSLDEAFRATQILGFPLVIKPRTQFGARGVRRIDDPRALAACYGESAALSPSGVLLEECIEGVETSVEGIAIDGRATVLAYADKELRAHKNYRVTRSINYPGAFTAAQVENIRKCAQATVTALGLENSPFHLEVFVVGERVLPIECGARGGGGHIFSQIVKLVSGVDLVRLAVDILLGNKPKEPLPVACRGACYRFLFPPEGLLLGMPNLEPIRRDDGFVSIAFSVKPGTTIREPDNGAVRAGCLVTRGSDRQSAYEAADRAEQMLDWQVRRVN